MARCFVQKMSMIELSVVKELPGDDLFSCVFPEVARFKMSSSSLADTARKNIGR
jgi:hypothetical protein